MLINLDQTLYLGIALGRKKSPVLDLSNRIARLASIY